MGGSCGRYEEGEMYAVFWWGNLKEREHLEELGVNGRIL